MPAPSKVSENIILLVFIVLVISFRFSDGDRNGIKERKFDSRGAKMFHMATLPRSTDWS